MFIITSCKKTDALSTSTPTPSDTTHYFPTGLVPSTEAEVQNIPFVESLDTALIPIFGRAQEPPSVNLIMPIPGNQKNNGSCIGWAVGYGMMSYQFRIVEGNSDYNGLDKLFSPAYIWNQLNGGKQDGGLSFGKALDLVGNQGCCKQIDMAADVDFTLQPSSIARTNAANYKLSDYQQIVSPSLFRFKNVDVSLMKKWLSNGYPIMVGLLIDNVFRNFYSIKAFEQQTDGRLVWKKYNDKGRYSHALLICGYDNSINAFKVLNSWGDQWANGGYFWLDYDFLRQAVETIGISLNPDIYIGYVKRPILSTSSISGVNQTTALTGGVISSDWGLTVTSRGVCWSTSPNPTVAGNKTRDGTGKGSFVSTITGIIPNTTYFVKAYATNSAGTSYGKQVSLTTLPLQAGEVLSPGTGRIWMDRNLGATRVATSKVDYLAYGDLYQWGRGSDGHQLINWTSSTSGTPVNGTTITLSNSSSPGHSLFILGATNTGDWLVTQNDNLWQGVSGINNPCPAGFRLPTLDEF